jgi:hypothetical protein
VWRWYLEVLSGVADMAGSGEERQRHNGRGEGGGLVKDAT